MIFFLVEWGERFLKPLCPNVLIYIFIYSDCDRIIIVKFKESKFYDLFF